MAKAKVGGEQDHLPSVEEAVSAELEASSDPAAEADTSAQQVSDEASDQPVVEAEGEGGKDAAAAMPVGEMSDEDWRKYWEGAGFNVTEEDTLESIANRTKQALQKREERIREIQDQVRFYQDSSRVRGQSSEPEAAGGSSEPAPSSGDPLDSLLDQWEDPRWTAKYLEQDENGFTRIKDGVDDLTKEKVMAVDRQMRQWTELLENPQALIGSLESRMKRIVEDHFSSSWDARTEEIKEQEAVNNFQQQNADWLYEKDPVSGQFEVDPMRPDQFVLSKEGAAFQAAMNQGAAMGITNLANQIKYAEDVTGRFRQQASAAPEQRRQSAQELADEKRREMRGQKNTRPRTQKEFNGVSPETADDVTGKDGLSFGEAAFAVMSSGA